MEEKFSVSLELMIQKFKDGAKKAQEVSQNVANKIKENMSVDVGSNAFKGMTAESELLLNKINDIKATLQMASADPKFLPKQDILEMRVELEKLEGQYNKINKSSNMFSTSFNKIQDGMNKSLKSAKRFTLSLFGIHSVYRMLSRASSAYLAQDTETSSKIQSAWIGLGSVFAPLLQTVANFTIKAVSYINVFIKALTGTDFLANAMAKSMNKANKSAGKLSKTLAGFDEITNLDDDAGGASVDTSWIDNFKNVELDPKVVKWLENLAIKMRPILETIKQIGKNIKTIWDDIFAPFFNFIIDNWDLVGKDIIGGILLIGIAIDIATGNWLGLILKFIGFVILYWDDLKQAIGVVLDAVWWLIKTTFNLIVDIIKGAIGIIKVIFDTVFGIVTAPFKNAWNTIKGVWDGAKQYFNGIKDIFVGIFTLDGNKIKNGLKQMLQGMGNVILAFISGVMNAFLIPLNSAIKLMNKIPGVNLPTLRVSIPKIPAFEVGTDYVPNDMMAQIHEGEKIVPKKFNSDEYIRKTDYSNNAKVESLLEELIDTLERKDMNAYISESSIGKASQNYRNLQSRIIGEELV
jgi:hypothetical protein